MVRYFLFTDSVSGERKVYSSDKIKVVNREAYGSLYYYDISMKDYLLSNGSVSSYDGNVYGDYFILDLDGDNLDELIIDMERLMNDIKDMSTFVFFSGRKGFHIYIPKDYVIYPEELESQWHIASKAFANTIRKQYPELDKYIDLSVYDKVRIFRLPFSIHPKTGRRKTLLSWTRLNKEVPTNSFASPAYKKQVILDAILNGMPHPEVHNPLCEITVEESKPKQENYVKKKDYFEFPYNEKLCIYKMINEHNLKGSRHVVALRLQSYWKEKGYNKDFTDVLLTTWNSKLDHPLTRKELDNILKFYDKGYIFNCQDPIKAKFCEPSCYLYKQKDVSKDYLYQGEDYVKKYIEEMNESKERYIDLSTVYQDWKGPMLKPGYVVVIAAGPGSGKTTFALNVMERVKHINWLFLSLEMGGVDITDKMLKLKEVSIDTPQEIEDFTESFKHVITVDKPDIKIEELEDYVNMVNSRYGVKIGAVLIDYLSLLDAEGRGQTEKAISISRALKKVAKKLKLVVFVLSQVPKEQAGNGNIPLGLDAPKDSGEIVNMADALWTIWRPNRNRAQVEDNILRMGFPKDRHGPAGYTVDFGFIGDKYQVKDLNPNQKQEEQE